jgi:hypothetical protein
VLLKRARDSRRVPRRARLAEETLGLCELGAPPRLISVPAGTLAADLRQVGMKRCGAHVGDERLGTRQQRIDGIVVAEGDFGARERHYVLSS